jgi:glyoxylase-like metal-dependent hydrolase (beta-lactamase superfamily II)
MGPARVPLPPHLRSILADNASPLTMAGTQTYLVGGARVAVIDPGPAQASHLDAIVNAAGQGVVTAILVTHGHPDHSEGARTLAERVRAPVRSHENGTLRDGDIIDTDAGVLEALHTPGHRADHMSFYWKAEAAVFCGDLMMGGQNTTLVASPEGDIGDYLASLERIRALQPRVIFPTHGDPFDNPKDAIDEYLQHRRDRQEQVMRALHAGHSTLDAIVTSVYGAHLAVDLRLPASGAILAYLDHLVHTGRVNETRSGWSLA